MDFYSQHHPNRCLGFCSCLPVIILCRPSWEVFFKSKLDHVLTMTQKALHDLTPPVFPTPSCAIISSVHPAAVSLAFFLFLKQVKLIIFLGPLHLLSPLLEHSALDPLMPDSFLSHQSQVKCHLLKDPFLTIFLSFFITLLCFFSS